MTIISVSLDNESTGLLESLKNDLGFRSKSKLIRAALVSLEKEAKGLERLSGLCNGVLTITYEGHEAGGMKELVERFEELIKTELHQHSGGNCIRVLMVRGEGKQIRELFAAIKIKKGVKSVSVNLV